MSAPSYPPLPPERAQDGAVESEEPDRRSEERYGPLALERTRKDDGRLLIFFRDAQGGQR